MFTYLPCMNFYKTAAVLDGDTLRKQFERNEAIIECLIAKDYNYPGVLMWAGFEKALYEYHLALEEEWRNRLDMEPPTVFTVAAEEKHFDRAALELPSWWGNTVLHDSHRASLIRIFPARYRKLWPFVPSDLEWYWP